jgi:hypothetical protein
MVPAAPSKLTVAERSLASQETGDAGAGVVVSEQACDWVAGQTAGCAAGQTGILT